MFVSNQLLCPTFTKCLPTPLPTVEFGVLFPHWKYNIPTTPLPSSPSSIKKKLSLQSKPHSRSLEVIKLYSSSPPWTSWLQQNYPFKWNSNPLWLTSLLWSLSLKSTFSFLSNPRLVCVKVRNLQSSDTVEAVQIKFNKTGSPIKHTQRAAHLPPFLRMANILETPFFYPMSQFISITGEVHTEYAKSTQRPRVRIEPTSYSVHIVNWNAHMTL